MKIALFKFWPTKFSFGPLNLHRVGQIGPHSWAQKKKRWCSHWLWYAHSELLTVDAHYEKVMNCNLAWAITGRFFSTAFCFSLGWFRALVRDCMLCLAAHKVHVLFGTLLCSTIVLKIPRKNWFVYNSSLLMLIIDWKFENIADYWLKNKRLSCAAFCIDIVVFQFVFLILLPVQRMNKLTKVVTMHPKSP